MEASKLKPDKKSMLLYVVTDRSWLGNNSFIQQVEEVLQNGATFLQLREKNLSYDEILKEAMEIKVLTDKYKVPFVINDNIEVALACNADGVHVGQDDMPAKEVRSLIGENKILGVSVQTVEQAIKAEEDGADYLGVGAVFSTSTKPDADTVSIETLKAICQSVSVPVVAIGGISEKNIMNLKDTGISGVAVVSAIFASPDVAKATRKLYELSKRMVSSS